MLAKIEFRQRVLSLTEQAQLIEALGKCRNPLVLATVLLMLETHLPVHTLIHKIFWRDVNWERQTLQQDRHCFKNFKPRSISLSPAAIQILQDLGPGKPTEPILNITYPTFKRTFERAYHRSGVRGVPVNDLGQMPARMAAKLGVMISVVQQDTEMERNATVAGVATRLFGTLIPDRNIITETLKRTTPETETEKTVIPKLAEAIAAGVPEDLSFEEMARHPVSVWVELTLGLTFESNKPRRAKPKTLKQATVELAHASGLPEPQCNEYGHVGSAASPHVAG